MVDIYNEVFTKLKTELPDVNVKNSYQNDSPKFPMVVFSEIVNNMDLESIDSSGETHSILSFEVNVYTNSKNKETDAKKISMLVNSVLGGFYKMSRDMSNPIPNYTDKSIYRILMRYSAKVSKDKKIFRR